MALLRPEIVLKVLQVIKLPIISNWPLLYAIETFNSSLDEHKLGVSLYEDIAVILHIMLNTRLPLVLTAILECSLIKYDMFTTRGTQPGTL